MVPYFVNEQLFTTSCCRQCVYVKISVLSVKISHDCRVLPHLEGEFADITTILLSKSFSFSLCYIMCDVHSLLILYQKIYNFEHN